MGQLPDRLIQPDLHSLFQGQQALIGFCAVRFAHYWYQLGAEADVPPVLLSSDPEELSGVSGGLDGVGAGQLYPFHRHVLVAGEEKVKVQFPSNFASNILPAVREHSTCFQLLLETSVVDAHPHVTLVPEGRTGRPSGLEGIGNPQSLQVLWLFPHVHKVGDHAGNSHPQAVGQGMYRPRADGQLATQVLYIGAQAYAVHGPQIIPKGLIAKVEVVIAQGKIVKAHRVKGRSYRVDRPLIPIFQVILCQRRSLQRISAVQHKGVPVLFHLYSHIQKAGILRTVGSVVNRKDMSMGI